jgi:hypothetical protein
MFLQRELKKCSTERNYVASIIAVYLTSQCTSEHGQQNRKFRTYNIIRTSNEISHRPTKRRTYLVKGYTSIHRCNSANIFAEGGKGVGQNGPWGISNFNLRRSQVVLDPFLIYIHPFSHSAIFYLALFNSVGKKVF